MPFVCPSCKTEGRYGLLTRGNGSKLWGCNGSHKDPETGRALRTCDWSCEEHEGLAFGCESVKEVMLRVAYVASKAASEIGVRALEPRADFVVFLGGAADELEQLVAKLRGVRAFVRAGGRT